MKTNLESPLAAFAGSATPPFPCHRLINTSDLGISTNLPEEAVSNHLYPIIDL